MTLLRLTHTSSTSRITKDCLFCHNRQLMSEYSEEEDDSRFDLELAFVAKDKRKTVQVEESSDSEIEARMRRREAKKLAKEAIKNDVEEVTEEVDVFAEPPAPDTNDTLADQEEEYRLWVEREIERIRQEILIKARFDLDAAKTAQRRKMTDKELVPEEKKQRGHMKYMQKYHHRGAYIRDDSEQAREILQRDFTAPVGDDLIDKTLLPESLRVRGELSERPKTKWTNLRNEDTTTPESRRDMRQFEKE